KNGNHEFDFAWIALPGILNRVNSVLRQELFTAGDKDNAKLCTSINGNSKDEMFLKHASGPSNSIASLLQIQSTIIAKYIVQRELATGTTSISSDNSVKITKQANEIKELQRDVAALKYAMETQQMIRVLNDNFEKLIKAISSTVRIGTVDVLLTKINQKLSALDRKYKTQDSQIKRLESAIASDNLSKVTNQLRPTRIKLSAHDQVCES
ncbi:Hypothetical predicted protein, partial [Paramuricea clavata]